jgi:hypothetical protein
MKRHRGSKIKAESNGGQGGEVTMEIDEREQRLGDVMQVLANELECCQSIHDVTLDIGAMIQSDQVEALLSKLVERDHLIRQLQCFEEELRSLIAQWGAWPGDVGGSGSGLHRTAKQIRSLMESVVSLDEAHRNAITDRKGRVSGELRRLREGRTMWRMYSDVPSREDHLVDRVVE